MVVNGLSGTPHIILSHEALRHLTNSVVGCEEVPFST
jgi:hypothetical protein